MKISGRPGSKKRSHAMEEPNRPSADLLFEAARTTKDVDFLATIPQMVLPGLLESLFATGFAFDVTTVIKGWTQVGMAVLHYQGCRIDWLKPVIPMYQHILDRAKPESWLGKTMCVAT